MSEDWYRRKWNLPLPDPSPVNMATTFYQFTRLPTKVRLLVWKFALPGPRVVFLEHVLTEKDDNLYDEVEEDEDIKLVKNFAEGGELLSDEHSFDCHAFHSRCPPPTLLFVNREARKVARKIYELTFGGMLAEAQTWFDFQRDTLVLDLGNRLHEWTHCLKGFDLSETYWVGKLGIVDWQRCNKWLWDMNDLDEVPELMGLIHDLFPGLEELYLVNMIDATAGDLELVDDVNPGIQIEYFERDCVHGEELSEVVGYYPPFDWMNLRWCHPDLWKEILPLTQHKSAVSLKTEARLKAAEVVWNERKRKYWLLKWEEKRWSETTSPERFTPFSKLPPELRLMIWKLSLPDPQLIQLRPWKLNDENGLPGKDLQTIASVRELRIGAHTEVENDLFETFPASAQYNFPFDSKGKIQGHRTEQPPPATLFVCKESAEVALKSYSCVFSSLGCQPETWFDPSKDSFEFSCHFVERYGEQFPDLVLPTDIDIVQHLVINLNQRHMMAKVEDQYELGLHSFLMDVLPGFKNLRKVTIVVPEYARFNPPWVDLQSLAALKKFHERYPENQNLLGWRIPEINEQFAREGSSTNCHCTHPYDLPRQVVWGWRQINSLRKFIRDLPDWKGIPCRKISGLGNLLLSQRYLHRETYDRET